MSHIIQGRQGSLDIVGTVEEKVVYNKYGATVAQFDRFEEGVGSFIQALDRTVALVDPYGIVWKNRRVIGHIIQNRAYTPNGKRAGFVDSHDTIEIHAGCATLLFGHLY